MALIIPLIVLIAASSSLSDESTTLGWTPKELRNITYLPGTPKLNDEESRNGKKCGGKVKLRPGKSVAFSSPNFGTSNYGNKQKCRWLIRAKGGAKLLLTCNVVGIETHRTCRRDYLDINKNRYCGAGTLVDGPFTKIKAMFKTNKKRTAPGFTCNVQAIDPTAPTPAPTTPAPGPATTPAPGPATTPAPGPATTPAPGPATTPVTSCKCGVLNRVSRIVGGSTTDVNEYPWQVGIASSASGNIWCGGSLISDQWILTAAHCVPGTSPSQIVVRIGEHDTSTSSETTTLIRSISQIISHGQYSSSTNDNDIALLKLSQSLVFKTDNKIAPVCLPPAGKTYDGVDATVSGWGTLTYQGNQPSKLKDVTIPVVTNSFCNSVYGSITKNMLCAGTVAGGKDSCQGDSGGPLITAANSAATFYELIGVVSFGYQCAVPNVPGVYARVTEYLNWIENKTGGLKTCSQP